MKPTFFIAWETADATLGKELAKHLRVVADKIGWQIMCSDDAPLGDDTPKWRRKQMEQAAALVLVASVDLFDEGTKPESALPQSLDLREKKPDLPLFFVLGRQTSFWPEVLHCPIFPEKDRPIGDGQHRDRDLALAAEGISELALRPKESAAVAADDDDFLIKKLPDAQVRLRDLLRKNRPSRAVELLKSIVETANEREKIASFEGEWTELHHDFNRTSRSDFPTFEAERRGLLDQLRDFVDSLTEDCLAKGWRSRFAQDWLGFEPTKTTGLPFINLLPFSGDIKIPETSRARPARRIPGFGNADDSHARTVVDEHYWPTGQKMEFKREMRLAQDCVAVENYEAAFKHCERVRHTLDPESAQLYEYLLVTFVKNEGAEAIMRNAIFGDGAMLRHIWLFAGRFMEYEQAGKCPSETGEWNVRAVAAALADALGQIYASFEEDYVLDLDKPAPSENRREQAKRCVEIALDLYRYLYRSPGFLDLTANELGGGGKFRWVDDVAVRDDNFHIFSRLGVDVETRIREIGQLLADYDRTGSGTVQADLLSQNLLGSLERKLREISRCSPGWRARLRDAEQRIREALLHVVNAAVLGYEIFRDEAFLHMAHRILFEQQEVDWFDLDEKGQLIEHAGCVELKFPARDILEKTLEILSKNSPKTIESGLEGVRLAVLRKYRADTAEQFSALESAVKSNPLVFELKNRRRTVECVRRWQILFHATGEAEFLDKAVQELSGAGLFQWLDFDPLHIVRVPAAIFIEFDPMAALRALRQLPMSWPEARIEEAIAGRIFEKIREEYAAVRAGDASRRADVAALLLKTLACQKLAPARARLDFLHSEISGETKLAWLDISPESHWANVPLPPGCPAFDALALLRQLAQLDARFNRLKARNQLAINRYHDAEQAYLSEVSEFREENGLPERRAAIAFIRRCKAIYRFYPDEKFLQRAYVELRNEERIRWRNPLLRWLNLRWVFPFDYHTDNMMFEFNYQWEMREIKLLWGASGELMEKVVEEEA